MNLKKPKFWDYKRPNIFAYLLQPIAFLLKISNLIKIKSKIRKSKIKTICVGNIYIGGTGKTSLSIKLNEIFNKRKIKSCFIKKFYKDQIDEQKVLQNKGKLFLSSKRVDAINQAESENYEIAILDDGLQDRSINCDINLICFNNINWIGNGLMIPAGPLRQDINILKKYDHIFLNGNLENLESLKKEIFKINSEINIHIGKYEPLNLNEFNKLDKYLIFSGIGNHETFISMAKNYGLNICKDIEFPDHYNYSQKDFDKIKGDSSAVIVTTEKDYYRIKDNQKQNFNYVEVSLEIENLSKFKDLIKECL